jgi:hypothetical protein
MSQEKELQLCPVCYEVNVTDIKDTQSGVLLLYKCKRCGEYYIDRILVGLDEGAWYEVKHLASAWIKRENKSGVTPIFGNFAKGLGDVSSPEWWSKQFEYLGLPKTTNEKMNALLVAFGENVQGYNGRVAPDYRYVSEIGVKSLEEIDGLTVLLSQAGYLRPYGNSGIYSISVNGWLHIDELRKTINSSNSAFVAMWFADDTKKYRDSTIAAINYCGYKPIIIDQQEYNDFIMNQVISSIKQSKFLVADFTSRPEIEKDGKINNGVRGGVYWEAGLAYGLGIPVLHTCEDNEDSKKRIHFDVNQYNTIYWKESELGIQIRPLDQPRPDPNFSEKLAARILATVGKGTYVENN